MSVTSPFEREGFNDDLVFYFLQFCGKEDLLSAGLTCSRFSRIAFDTSILWENLLRGEKYTRREKGVSDKAILLRNAKLLHSIFHKKVTEEEKKQNLNPFKLESLLRGRLTQTDFRTYLEAFIQNKPPYHCPPTTFRVLLTAGLPPTPFFLKLMVHFPEKVFWKRRKAALSAGNYQLAFGLTGPEFEFGKENLRAMIETGAKLSSSDLFSLLSENLRKIPDEFMEMLLETDRPDDPMNPASLNQAIANQWSREVVHKIIEKGNIIPTRRHFGMSQAWYLSSADLPRAIPVWHVLLDKGVVPDPAQIRWLEQLIPGLNIIHDVSLEPLQELIIKAKDAAKNPKPRC